MNIPALLALTRIARDPRLCLPHHTIPTFAQLPIPVSNAFGAYTRDGKQVEIRAVVLDKDNCFAAPGGEGVYPGYAEKFQSLLKAYPASNILIVSNTAGLASADPEHASATRLSDNTGVRVLRHASRKPAPACGDAILAHFREHGEGVDCAAQIAVVGDRLFTDVVMANEMGAWAVWIREGVVRDRGAVTRVEYGVVDFLTRRGYMARRP